MNTHNKIFIAIATLLALGLIIFALSSSNAFGKNKDPHFYDAFAECLTQKNVVMYGASWCPHCQATKQAFGDSFQYITYVECVTNPALCAEKGIDGYPTWLIGTTTKVEGFDKNTFKELSIATGCPLPQN